MSSSSSSVSIATIASMADPAAALSKLKRYIANTLKTTRYKSSESPEFFEKHIYTMMNNIFGKPGGEDQPWFEYAEGVRYHLLKVWVKKKVDDSYARSKVAKARVANSLIELFATHERSKKPFSLLLVETTRKLFFPVKLLPAPDRRCVFRSEPHASALLQHILRRHLRKRRVQSTIRDNATDIELYLKEFLIMYLAWYGGTSKSKGRKKQAKPRSKVSHAGATRAFKDPSKSPSRLKEPGPLLYRTMDDVVETSPYPTIVRNLCEASFDPPDGETSTTIGNRDLLVQFFTSFWFSAPQPLSSAITVKASRSTSSPSTWGRGDGLARKIDATLTEYVAPTMKLLEAAVVFLSYVLAAKEVTDGVKRKALDTSEVMDTPLSLSPGFRLTKRPSLLPPLLQALHRPIFNFFTVHVDRMAVESDEFAAFVDCWLTFLTPWRAELRIDNDLDTPYKKTLTIVDHLKDFRELITEVVKQRSWKSIRDDWDSKEQNMSRRHHRDRGRKFGRPRPIPKADFTEEDRGAYTAYWEPFVTLHYAMYVDILSKVLARIRALDFMTADPPALGMLERICDVFEPVVVDTLRTCGSVLKNQEGETKGGDAESHKFNLPGRAQRRQREFVLKLLKSHLAELDHKVHTTLDDSKADAEALRGSIPCDGNRRNAYIMAAVKYWRDTANTLREWFNLPHVTYTDLPNPRRVLRVKHDLTTIFDLEPEAIVYATDVVAVSRYAEPRHIREIRRLPGLNPIYLPLSRWESKWLVRVVRRLAEAIETRRGNEMEHTASSDSDSEASDMESHDLRLGHVPKYAGALRALADIRIAFVLFFVWVWFLTSYISLGWTLTISLAVLVLLRTVLA